MTLTEQPAADLQRQTASEEWGDGIGQPLKQFKHAVHDLHAAAQSLRVGRRERPAATSKLGVLAAVTPVPAHPISDAITSEAIPTPAAPSRSPLPPFS